MYLQLITVMGDPALPPGANQTPGIDGLLSTPRDFPDGSRPGCNYNTDIYLLLHPTLSPSTYVYLHSTIEVRTQ